MRSTQSTRIMSKFCILIISMIFTGISCNSRQIKGFDPMKSVPNFIEMMQTSIDDKHEMLELKLDPKSSKMEHIIQNAVTFKSEYTFIGLSQLKVYSTMKLRFQIKTLESDGLILYNAGKIQDFIAIELESGHLNYVFNVGDGPRKLRSNTTINDNRWHSISISRPSVRQHTLMVNNVICSVSITGSNMHFDLDGLLYLGGVRSDMYESLPKMIQSKHGFEGCIASLELNGEAVDPSSSDALIPSTLVASGCAGPLTKCSNTACANRGICVQMWNSNTCDCDMTSYSGPTCADESTAYQFGPNNGLITFTFPNDKRPDTKNDLLALGFSTTVENAVLVRIDSGSTNDYIELELVDGNVVLVYNMGTGDLSIGELSVKVNDGGYHIVRFTRSGQNSTIQVDNHNIITKSPVGRQLTIFNTHSKVQIGGKKNSAENLIENPFHGIIAGFVFNGHKILDMAVEDDSRITIEGDVKLVMSITSDRNEQRNNENSFNEFTNITTDDNNPQMHQPKSSVGYEGDDLIYSGAGSGCFDADDEDDCSKGLEGSGDDLITTVSYSKAKPSTPMPPHSRISTDSSIDSSHKLCDDDEDCIDGSGSGEQTYSITSKSNNVHPVYGQPGVHTHQTIKTPRPEWPEPTSHPIGEPPIIRKYPYLTTPDYNPLFEFTHRPVTTAPATNKPMYVITGPTRHPTIRPPLVPLGPPDIYTVPPLEIPKTFVKDTPKPTGKVPKSTNDRTVMIIGVIAIGLIIVVIIAPIVLFFKVKYRNGANYKIEENKNFQFAPVSGTPPLLGSGLQQTHLINGGTSRTSPTDHHKPLLKMPKKKDLKEWYV